MNECSTHAKPEPVRLRSACETESTVSMLEWKCWECGEVWPAGTNDPHGHTKTVECYNDPDEPVLSQATVMRRTCLTEAV